MMTRRGAWWIGRTATTKVSVTNSVYRRITEFDPTVPRNWVRTFSPKGMAAITYHLDGPDGHGRLVLRPLTKKERQAAADYDSFLDWVKVFDLALYGEKAEA